MAAFRSASFCLIVCFLLCSSEAQEKITAKLGKNVTLPCRDPNINNIAVVEWSRPGQKTEYVLVYRDGHFDPHNQNPSYQDRVYLKYKNMKDGDASLNLMNVMKADTGIYKCWVFQGGTNRRKRSDPEPINIINLEVHGDKDEIIGGSVVGGILLAVLGAVGFLIYRRPMKKKLNVTSEELAAEQML